MPGKKAGQAVPNLLLRRARQDRGWSQAYVADQIEAPNTLNVIRWERGTSIPSFHYRQKLCSLFGKSPRELGFVLEEPPIRPYDLHAPIYDPAIPSQFADPQDFIGRSEVLGRVKQQLLDKKNVVLTALNGIPGVGKTALVVELAHDVDLLTYFRDGILWAGFGPHPNIIGVLGRWGKLLGLSDQEMEKLHDIEALSLAIRTALRERRMMLVIDDAWRVEDVLALELGGDSTAYIITTRLPDLASYFAKEEAIVIEELSEKDGVKLLERLVPSVVKAEPEEALALVRMVGGLPLALTLMGSYLIKQARHKQSRRIHAALEALHDIERRLTLEDPQGGLKRHTGLPAQTPLSLQAVIGISYEALDDPSRQALRAFSVFPAKPNTFSEEAALSIAAISEEILDRLVDSGLVEVAKMDRYTLHQTIADYAYFQHMRSDLDAVIELRMATYFSDYIERHEKDYEGLEQETDNIDKALQLAYEQGLPSVLIKGVNAFYQFTEVRGLYMLIEIHLKHAQAMATLLDDPSTLVTALLNLGRIAEKNGDYDQAENYLKEGLKLARQLEKRERISDILRLLGILAGHRGDYTQAESYLQEALVLARESGQPERIASILQSLGVASDIQGKHIQAESYLQEGLILARQMKLPQLISVLLINLGVVVDNQGNSALEDEYLKEALQLARQIGHRELISLALTNLGVRTEEKKDYIQALNYYQEGLSLARQIGHRERATLLLINLGVLNSILGLGAQQEDIRRGYCVQAEEFFRGALSMAHELKNRWLISGTLTHLGTHLLEQNQLDLASAAFHEALEVNLGDYQNQAAEVHYGLAKIADLQGNAQTAHYHGQISLKLYQSIATTEEEFSETAKQWLASLLARGIQEED